jgi:hypothetical protein
VNKCLGGLIDEKDGSFGSYDLVRPVQYERPLSRFGEQFGLGDFGGSGALMALYHFFANSTPPTV